MNSYDKEIYFHLPGIFEHAPLFVQLLKECSEHPEYFKDNACIGSIYGAPGGIWNGGRLLKNNQRSKEDMENIEKVYSSCEVPIRFTFTNPLIVGNLVYDAYCNLVLDIFNTGNNEILCNSEELETYLRNKYGDNYRYISSTTKRLTTKDEQTEEINKDYYLVVLDYDHNKDFEYLESIEDKSKCEILVNPVCRSNCPKRVEHYMNIAKCQLENIDNVMSCPFNSVKEYYLTKQQDNYISPEMINEVYIPMGFKHFKIEGRTSHPLDIIEMLVDYLVKEEYKLEIRQKLQVLFV